MCSLFQRIAAEKFYPEFLARNACCPELLGWSVRMEGTINRGTVLIRLRRTGWISSEKFCGRHAHLAYERAKFRAAGR